MNGYRHKGKVLRITQTVKLMQEIENGKRKLMYLDNLVS
jgi:hypothetical protein